MGKLPTFREFSKRRNGAILRGQTCLTLLTHIVLLQRAADDWHAMQGLSNLQPTSVKRGLTYLVLLSSLDSVTRGD